MAIFASAAEFDGIAPLESRICQVGHATNHLDKIQDYLLHLFQAGGQYLFKYFVLRPSQVVIEPIVFAIVFASSSSEYSWSENRLKSGDLNSSRLNVLKCLQDDQNSRSGSLTDEFPSDNAKDADITNALLLPLAHGHEARHN
ncbi:hypothetical protein Tco_0511528 [Tanacetum coccineum]